MRNIRTMTRRLLTCLLATILACGSVPMQVAWALESVEPQVSYDVSTQAETDATVEPVSTAEPEAGAEDSASTDAATPQSNDNANEPSATSDDENAETSTVDAQSNVTDPYSIKVTFGDDELNEGENNLGTWSDGTKALNITLTRNTSVPVDSSKTYVLSMAVPDALYFNGIPKADEITGVEEVSFKKNATPQVVTNNNAAGNYSQFSPYSGEIRMRLNTQVPTVTVANLGVNFDPRLVGYKTANELLDALDVKVVALESSSLDYESASVVDKAVLERKVTSITMNNGRASSDSGAVRQFVSSDGFVRDITSISKILSISKGGSISYALGASNMTQQVYKELVIVFQCPYIQTSDGQKHYLEFDPADSSITSNRQGTRSGLRMTGNAIYDANNHTITYSFANVLFSEWAQIVFTPRFTWPSDLIDEKTDSASYKIEGNSWSVTKQASYLGAESTLFAREDGKLNPYGGATFVPDSVDLQLKSSHESSGLSKFNLYSGLADGKSVGSLGFFDLHSVGVSDAPKTNITFEFNTDSSGGARYHVSRVNLPIGGNDSGTTVEFALSNGTDTKSGSVHYGATSSNYLGCNVATLRSQVGVGSDYYIERLSYACERLAGGTVYHSEVADGGRYYMSEPGLFRGWISGKAGQTASAKMTIAAADGTSALTKKGDTSISSTEVSTISEDSSIPSSLNTLNVGNSKSTSITAGQSSSISIGFSMTDEERPYKYSGGENSVNGYHVIENPAVYVCLPTGVSITGEQQATLSSSGSSRVATRVYALPGSDCTVNGIKAKWWAVEFDDANVMSTGTVEIKLATARLMSSMTWDFDSAVALRSRGQYVKSASSTSSSGIINTATQLKSDSHEAIQALGAALESDSDANGKLGVVYWKYAESRVLNISRAEAKLDVSTSLSQGESTDAGTSVKVTDENATVNYDVNVSSTEGGSAKKFSYYIPVVKKGATLDASAFTTRSDYSLKLAGEVSITGTNEGGTELKDMPFDVLYTTEPNLTPSSIQALDSSKWQTADGLNGDFSQVTAVKIITKDNEERGTSTIWPGSSFKFELKFSYDNAASDFAANAGQSVAWRTFGHYVYERGGDTTENTYPSGVNSVKLGYVSNRTDNPIDVTLDTSTGVQGTATLDLGQAFNTSRTLKVKKVTGSNLNLTGSDPSGLSGTSANDTFRIALGLNEREKRLLSDGAGGSYDIPAGQSVSADVAVDFSTALTDASSKRYVDVTIGDDDIDITLRVNLTRAVKPADAKDAGVAVGENYNAPKVSSSVTIADNSAFSALFPVSDFVPANYSAQKLKWKTSAGAAANIPSGTTIIMVGLKADNTPESYWLYRATGSKSEVDLSEFKSMDTGKAFSYDKKAVAPTSLKYLFVVNFAKASAATGSYKIAFGADAVSGAAAFKDVEKDVELVAPGTYGLQAAGSQLTYTADVSAGNESYLERKSLSLVLTPAENSDLPADAKISDGDHEYTRNTKGEFVVPLGTIASGSRSFNVVSNQLPSAGGSYTFDAKLMLVGTTADASPDAGTAVASATLTLGTASSPSPSLSVTGTRVATIADWNSGQQFDLTVDGLDDCSLTVTAYRGLTGSDRVTDLLSSVGGSFKIENGVGTYNGGVATGKLQLNSAASPGTYRLVFEIKSATGETLATVPYAIIVRD